MEKDFYKDLEKIKTIGSTYMAAVGLVPVAGAKVGAVGGPCLGTGSKLCPQLSWGPGWAPALGLGLPCARGWSSGLGSSCP